MSYKLLSEDDKSYLVKHPNGSQFKVAKKGISKELHEKIKGYYDGGDVVDGGYTDEQPYTSAPVLTGPVPTPPKIPAPSINAGYMEAPETLAAKEASLATQQAAQTKIADIGAQEATSAAQEADRLANELRVNKEYYDRDHQHLLDDNKKLMEDYGSGKIDPERLHNEASLGKRVQNGLALILGGLGGVGTGGRNLVAERLDKLVDQDIEAQKANMNTKNNLLGYNFKLLGDMEQAAAKTKADTLGMAQVRLTKIANTATSQRVKQNAVNQIAIIEGQKQDLLANVAGARLQNKQYAGAAQQYQTNLKNRPTAFDQINQKKSAESFAENQKSIPAIAQGMDRIDEAIEAHKEYSKNHVGGTGPISQVFGARKIFSEDAQNLDAKLKDIDLKNMVTTFSGMSKAVDSQAERKAWQSTQASTENDDAVNLNILYGAKSSMLKNKAVAEDQQAYVAKHKNLDGFEKSNPILQGKVTTVVDPTGKMHLVPKERIKDLEKQGFYNVDNYVKKLVANNFSTPRKANIAVGKVSNGYKYKGGDPNDKKSWEK